MSLYADLLARLLTAPVALSIRQPFCHSILHEGKDVENRDWPTRFRGPVLIHAGKKVYEGYEDDYAALSLPRGGIVGVMLITDCVTKMESRWFCGDYGFVISNALPLPLIPCKGKQGFFNPDIDAAALRAAALHMEAA